MKLPNQSFTLIALAGLSLFPAFSFAQTVNMHLTDVTPQTTVSGHAGTEDLSATTGLLRFTVDSVTPIPMTPFPSTLDLFCVELAQYVNFNTVNSYQILTASSAAAGVGTGRSANIGLAGIGATRARNLEILYASVFGSIYDPLALDNDSRVAFQLAVWELSHDDDYSLASISTSNHFWVTSPTDVANRGLAQYWVTAVDSLNDDVNAQRMTLSVLHSETTQDFLLPNLLYTVIPEPSTYAAIMGALVAAGVALRRARQAAVA